MNRMESTSAAHLVEMTQPEEFDLVILGGGTGSTSPRGHPRFQERREL